MAALTTAEMILFENFRLDRSGLSRRDHSGAFVPVPVGSRALEIFAVLVARPGELVTRDEIIKEVWPGTLVEYSNIAVQIASLRRALDPGRTEGSLIQTVPGRGYRFAGAVSRASPATSQPVGAPRLSIVVLPFANLSDDREQQYFADGITEDLTTDLSRIPGMFVISCNTAFTYKKRPSTQSRSAASWASAMSLKGVSGDRAIWCVSTRSSSMPRPTDISGRSGSTGTRPTCSLCKTRLRAGLRTRLAPN